MPPFVRFSIAAVLAAVITVVAGTFVDIGAGEELAEPDPTTTTTSTDTVEVEAPWLEGGVRFRNTVVTPVAFVVDEGTAELEYELVGLGPAFGDQDEFSDIPVRPEVWELATKSGATFETAVHIDDHFVRWEIPDDIVAADVAEVRVVGWRVATPVGSRVVLPLVAGATETLHDGTELTVGVILEQANATIVQIDSRVPPDPWRGGDLFGSVTVTEPGWRITFRFGSEDDVQLIWDGDDPPAEVELVQAGPEWLPITAETVVFGGEAS
jgi:hypothetical protein